MPNFLRWRWVGLLLGGLWLAAPLGVQAQGPPPLPRPQAPGVPAPLAGPPPVLQYMAPGVFAMGKCQIVKAEGKVTLPATVNMVEGPLEYLLVGQAGKLHESLLRTEVEPYSLQVALLLAGLEGSLSPLSRQGEDRLPIGDAVEIEVRWQVEGKPQQVPIEELVQLAKQPPGRMPWVFTGSLVRDGVFAAQAEKSIIAVYHDPLAMIDHRQPQGNSDEVWSVNPETTPAVGTPVTVVIRKQAPGPGGGDGPLPKAKTGGSVLPPGRR